MWIEVRAIRKSRRQTDTLVRFPPPPPKYFPGYLVGAFSLIAFSSFPGASGSRSGGWAPFFALVSEPSEIASHLLALTLATNENTRGGTDTRFAPTFDGDVERWADWHFAFTAYAHSRKW